MEQQTNNRIVTLKDLWSIFVSKIWIIILAAAIAVGAMYLFNSMTFEPQYESTATLYILRQDQGSMINNGNYSSDDFSLALKVVSDCDYLLKSHSVLDEVIDELDLNISYEQLARSVSTSNPDSTRILEVKVVSDTPEQAKRIVDKVCRVGTEKIAEAMGFDQVNLFEYGVLNNKPCNSPSLTSYILIGLLTAIAAYIIFLLEFFLDDRIRTDDDIERYLGLSILGNIPNADDPHKARYGYYKQYGYGKKNKPKNKRGE